MENFVERYSPADLRRYLNQRQSGYGAAIRMGGATSDQIDCGNPAMLTDIATATICAWVNNTVTATNQRIWQKGSGGNSHLFRLNSSQWGIVIQRATSPQNVQASVANFAAYAINKWIFVVGQWDLAGSNSDQKIYIGDEVRKPEEPSSYNIAQTAGSGTINTDAAVNFGIGNLVGSTASWVGPYAAFGMWGRLLSFAEIVDQWDLGRRMGGLMARTAGCISLIYPGLGALRKIDWSGFGNHGTLSGGVYTPFGVPQVASPEWHNKSSRRGLSIPIAMPDELPRFGVRPIAYR